MGFLLTISDKRLLLDMGMSQRDFAKARLLPFLEEEGFLVANSKLPSWRFNEVIQLEETITIAAPEQSDYNESSEAKVPHTIKWQQPLRSKREVSEVCSRLSIAVYTHSGNSYSKVNEVSQQRDDKNFGTTSLTLAQGTYTIVAIAHNGDGKPTMTDPKKIPFANNKVTDTFYATEEIVVG